MTTTFQAKYPASNADSGAITLSLNSLASDSNLVAGRESTALDNRTNLDLDILISGKVKVGTSPTTATVIEVWAHCPLSISSGTPTYNDVLTGSDAAATMTSSLIKQGALRLLWSQLIDSTTGRVYYMPQTSIRQAFGWTPAFVGIFLTHNTGVALDASAGGSFYYHRSQEQGA